MFGMLGRKQDDPLQTGQVSNLSISLRVIWRVEELADILRAATAFPHRAASTLDLPCC